MLLHTKIYMISEKKIFKVLWKLMIHSMWPVLTSGA